AEAPHPEAPPSREPPGRTRRPPPRKRLARSGGTSAAVAASRRTGAARRTSNAARAGRPTAPARYRPRAARSPGGREKRRRDPSRPEPSGPDGFRRRRFLDLLPPAVLFAPGRGGFSADVGENEVAHLLEHPAEVVLLDRKVVEIGRGVQEVDGVQDAVFDRELDRVHVIAERLDQGSRVLYGLVAEPALNRVRGLVALFERRLGVVADREDVVASDADAPDVVVPVDKFLQDHRLQAGLVVRGDELLHRADDEDVLPRA